MTIHLTEHSFSDSCPLSVIRNNGQLTTINQNLKGCKSKNCKAGKKFGTTHVYKCFLSKCLVYDLLLLSIMDFFEACCRRSTVLSGDHLKDFALVGG
jgi:hypothetical protein